MKIHIQNTKYTDIWLQSSDYVCTVNSEHFSKKTTNKIKQILPIFSVMGVFQPEVDAGVQLTGDLGQDVLQAIHLPDYVLPM